MTIKDKVFVVTGGGSGMGRQLALLLLKKGAKVTIADINLPGMEETASMAGSNQANLSTHELDITDRDKVNAFPQVVIEQHGAVDAIINNAGIIQPFIKVSELEFSTVERVMNINFYGTLNMIKAFLPHLLKRPEAHIANVASMGGFLPVPGQTIYGASKAAVKLLTEGLHAELMDTNVNVTVLFPGAVATSITENSGVSTPTGGLDPTELEAQASKALAPEKAAEIMVKAIEKNKFRELVGSDASFLDKFYRLAPKRAAGFIARQMKALLS